MLSQYSLLKPHLSEFIMIFWKLLTTINLLLLYRYWSNTRIFPFTKKSYLHRAQWRYYFIFHVWGFWCRHGYWLFGAENITQDISHIWNSASLTQGKLYQRTTTTNETPSIHLFLLFSWPQFYFGPRDFSNCSHFWLWDQGSHKIAR